jgi:DNA-binding MarR family transcriptional regulator
MQPTTKVRPSRARVQAPDETSAEAAAQSLVGLLPTIYRAIVAAMHDAPHTAGMTLAQFRVVTRLSERDYRATELAAALEVGAATLTVTADSLVRRGLIERIRELPGDRRAVVLRLTPAGRTLHRALETRAVAAMSCWLERVSPSERTALACGLDGLRRVLQTDGHAIACAPEGVIDDGRA